jgi:type IV secretory pathway VirB3-like protein
VTPANTQPSLRRESPPEWSYNPSQWSQRIPIVVLALIGGAAATWLALYQEGVVSTVWEPFFGDGTRRIVLESGFSQMFQSWPIGDAGIGALGYLADAVTGVIGGVNRWKTMPWIVIIFGVFVGPFGIVSVMLTIFQPVLYNAFCTLCLVSGVVSLAMIGPAADEVLASLQHLRRVKDEGRSVWGAFWGRDR